MTCIIIEDQPPAQRILKKYINDMGHLDLKATFSNALDAITFLNTQKVDLIFLDIHLPKISGMDFLKSTAPNSHVILTTAFSEYALESYEYNVVDYLLKPFSFQRFVKAISKIPNIQNTSTNPANTSSSSIAQSDSIFIKSGYEHIKISLADILYIKSEADYTEIFITNKKHLTSNPLRYWLEKLDSTRFCQIHKSYIVNVNQVVKVSGNMATLNNGDTIPIGRSFKESFGKRFLM